MNLEKLSHTLTHVHSPCYYSSINYFSNATAVDGVSTTLVMLSKLSNEQLPREVAMAAIDRIQRHQLEWRSPPLFTWTSQPQWVNTHNRQYPPAVGEYTRQTVCTSIVAT